MRRELISTWGKEFSYLSSAPRSQLPSVAAGAYVLWQNSSNEAVGDSAFRTSSCIRKLPVVKGGIRTDGLVLESRGREPRTSRTPRPEHCRRRAKNQYCSLRTAKTFRIPIILARNCGIVLAFPECSLSAELTINKEQKETPV